MLLDERTLGPRKQRRWRWRLRADEGSEEVAHEVGAEARSRGVARRSGLMRRGDEWPELRWRTKMQETRTGRRLLLGGSARGGLGGGWIPRKRIGVATAPRKTREAREDGGWLWLIPMGIERVAARWNKKPRF